MSDDSPPADFDPERDLPGAVFMVPNAHWGFEIVTATDHPGACLEYRPASRVGVLVQGTDVEHITHRHLYYEVQPDEKNKLQKPTAFRLVPRYLRLHRLKLYFPERHVGDLDEATLNAVREELARLHPEG